MKISIVTVSFNQAAFLATCIESVLSQDYANLEYIIVDPGSTDGSRAIIERYHDRIDKVIFAPDNGPADGLNKGFRLATGDVFYYLNADDILLHNALSQISKCFEAMPESDVIYANGYRLDRTGNIVNKLFSTRWGLNAYAYGAVSIVQQATFFRREAFLRTEGFNPDNRTCWDGELLVDMSLAGARFTRVNLFLGGFRIYDESISGSGRLNYIYEQDCRRIREKIVGTANNTHICQKAIYRLAKYLTDPLLFYSRFLSRYIPRKGNYLK